jgi:hypothetical protein
MQSPDDIIKAITHSLNHYSSWHSYLDLEMLANTLLQAKAAPLCAEYDVVYDIDRKMDIDVLLCLNSDSYFKTYKDHLVFDRFSVGVFETLDHAYSSAEDNPIVMDRIERLFALFLANSSHAEKFVLLAPYGAHPRYAQRIETEVNRLGARQFMITSFRQYGCEAWPIMIGWKAPEMACLSSSEMQQEHFKKLMDIYQEFMSKQNFVRHVMKRLQYHGKSAAMWAKEITLDEMMAASGFSNASELFLGVNGVSNGDLKQGAQHLALTKALICPETYKLLSKMTRQQGRRIMGARVLPRKLLHDLNWTSNQERRNDLERDIGL